MRLLDVETKELREFPHAANISYAILSHYWEEDEVLYHDIINKTAVHRKGYAKIASFCSVAAKDGFRYVWVDTCCIDKSSSTELSEAINSMFSWYQLADVCFAYLSDCGQSHVIACSDLTKHRAVVNALGRSRWFSRGWTLQELIAPTTVVFLSSQWVEMGTKRELRKALRDITNIHEDTLVDPSQVDKYCVAQRLSWAANRVTTRPEDQAYSLMGLLDVNMPLLYGEGGENAFIRLQLEILKKFNDQSILAWRYSAADRSGMVFQSTSGVLASSVSCFRWCHGIKHRPRNDFRSLQSAVSSFPQEVVGPFVKLNGLSIKYDLREHERLRSLGSQGRRPVSVTLQSQPQPQLQSQTATGHQRSISQQLPVIRAPERTPDWLSHIYGQFKGPSLANQWLSNLYIMLLEDCSTAEDEMIGIVLREDRNSCVRAHYPSVVTLPKPQQRDMKHSSKLQEKVFHVLSYPPRPKTSWTRTSRTIHLLTQPASYTLWRSQPQMCYADGECFSWPHWCAQGNGRLAWMLREPRPLTLWAPTRTSTDEHMEISLAFRTHYVKSPLLPHFLLRFKIKDDMSLLIHFMKGGDEDLNSAYANSAYFEKDPDYSPLDQGTRKFHLEGDLWVVIRMREGRGDTFLHVDIESVKALG